MRKEGSKVVQKKQNKRAFLIGFPAIIEDQAFLSTEELYRRVGHNTGNLAFQYAVFKHLGGNVKVIPQGAHPDLMNSTGDIAVLPAANQLGAHARHSTAAERFSQLDCTIVMIGLGAQSSLNNSVPVVPEPTIRWIKEISKRRSGRFPNISVRGLFTNSVLEHYGLAGQAVVLGCPSLFINPDPELGHQIASRLGPIKRIAVVAGHQTRKHAARVEASLARLASATDGSYVGQSGLEIIRLTRGEAGRMPEEDLRQCRDYICPEMNLEEFVRWTERYGRVFFDVPSWMEHYRRFDLVLGTRIHGVMLALQAGVPGLVVVHDSRTLELCEMMNVPHVLISDVASGIDRENLSEMIKFDPATFDANRQVLADQYVKFLESNELYPASWLKDIASCVSA